MPDGSFGGTLLALTAATPKPVGPSPSPTAQKFNPNDVTPGTVGFIVTFAMVIVVIFLMLDLVKRIRRITVKGEEAERRAAAEAGRAAAARGAAGQPPAGPDAGGAAPGGRAGRGATTGGRRPPSLKKPPGGAPTPTG